MFVIYYAPRHYDILIKLLKASTMRFIAISLATIEWDCLLGREKQASNPYQVSSQK